MVLYFGDIIYHCSGAYEVFLVNKSSLSDVMGGMSQAEFYMEILDKLWCIKQCFPTFICSRDTDLLMNTFGGTAG